MGPPKLTIDTQTELPDLTLIDRAFGNFADLYSDVLRVSVAASHEHIQMAYFERRSELFGVLADLSSAEENGKPTTTTRAKTEQKMDALVLAVRVLGHATQRGEYDDIRQERLLNRRRAAHGQLEGFEAVAPPPSLDAMEDEPTLMRSSRKKRGSRKQQQQQSRKEANQKLEKEEARSSIKSTKAKDKAKASARVDLKIDTEDSKKSKAKDKVKNMDGAHGEPNTSTEYYEPTLSTSSKETQDTDHMTEDEADDEGPEQPTKLKRKTRSFFKRLRGSNFKQDDDEDEKKDEEETPTDTETVESRQMDATIDDDETATQTSRQGQEDEAAVQTSLLGCGSSSGFLRQIGDEISGACEDALVSIDQVFHAFTLTDRDIQAVTRRIDRAKEQL